MVDLPKNFDATELAHLIRAKEITPTELLDVFYRRVSETKGRLHTLIDVEYDGEKRSMKRKVVRDFLECLSA